VDAIIFGTGFHIRDQDWTSIEVRRGGPGRLQRRGALTGTVYNTGGCSSYNLDVNGRNSFIWSWSTGQMRKRIRRFAPDDYDVRERRPTISHATT